MMKSAVIFDMDGTLCDVSSIRHHVIPIPPSRSKNFDAFHAESVNCPPVGWVAQMSRMFDTWGYDILIVTARKAKFRNQTAMWLALNDIPSTALFMRRDDDHRPDYQVKKDILSQIRKIWEPKFAFDDNPNVIKLWEENDIATIRVEGYFE